MHPQLSIPMISNISILNHLYCFALCLKIAFLYSKVSEAVLKLRKKLFIVINYKLCTWFNNDIIFKKKFCAI